MTELPTALRLTVSQDPCLALTTDADAALVLTGPALADLVGERMEQVHRHGHTPARDLRSHPLELAMAAVAYATTAVDQLADRPLDASPPIASWPWHPDSWRAGDARKNLVKAAALLWATIDRLDNAPADAGDRTVTDETTSAADAPAADADAHTIGAIGKVGCEFCHAPASASVVDGALNSFAACAACAAAAETDRAFFGDQLAA